MTDPDRHPRDTTIREWMKAVLVVGLGAVLTTAFLVWFAFTFVAGPCCAYPSPGA